MFKAAAIQAKLNVGGPSAVLQPNLQLQGWVTTHNLPSFAATAGVALTNGEQQRLRRFQKYVIWAGRYPVPKTMREKHPAGALYIDFDVSNRDEQAFCSLFSRAEQSYLEHRAASGIQDEEESTNRPAT